MVRRFRSRALISCTSEVDRKVLGYNGNFNAEAYRRRPLERSLCNLAIITYANKTLGAKETMSGIEPPHPGFGLELWSSWLACSRSSDPITCSESQASFRLRLAIVTYASLNGGCGVDSNSIDLRLHSVFRTATMTPSLLTPNNGDHGRIRTRICIQLSVSPFEAEGNTWPYFLAG